MTTMTRPAATEAEPPHRIQDLETLELKLAQLRDEARLKLHLMWADARDAWEGIEQKRARFRAHARELRAATGEAADDVWKGVRALGHEIAEGYEAIRCAL